MKEKIIENCYKKSIEVMKANSGEFGFLASATQEKAIERNYLSVFSRDASICSLAALVSGEKDLISTAKKSIETLAKNQAGNGQIPNYVKVKGATVDFWKLDCIDSSLWWLIALKFFDKYSGSLKFSLKYKNNIQKAIQWLQAREHPGSFLLSQGEAGDWADIMPRSGTVLYSNSLWLYVKKLYDLGNPEASKKFFKSAFYPFDKKTIDFSRCQKTTAEEIIKKSIARDYFLSYVGYLYWGEDIDVYGNALAIIFNIESKKFSNRIIDKIESLRKNNSAIPCLFSPIKKNSKQWRKYMESHKQNLPGKYHNGGIWPFISCFWAIALFQAGRKKEARKELERAAQLNALNNWEFNEWFDVKTGKPSGMKRQTWNAGMFIIAYHYLKKNFIF